METTVTAAAIRYPKADPVQRFAILDLTAPQLRLLIDAAEVGIEDVVISDFDPAEHSPYPEIRETATRLLTDHELALVMGGRGARPQARPIALRQGVTPMLACSLALIGALFLGTVLFSHVSARTAITVEQAVAMRGM